MREPWYCNSILYLHCMYITGPFTLVRGSPHHADFGTWKKPVYMKFPLDDCRGSPTNAKIPHLQRIEAKNCSSGFPIFFQFTKLAILLTTQKTNLYIPNYHENFSILIFFEISRMSGKQQF